MSLGPMEIVLILAIALLFFGPSKLPSLGKSVGEAIRGFKKAMDNPDAETQGQEKREQVQASQSGDDAEEVYAKSKKDHHS